MLVQSYLVIQIHFFLIILTNKLVTSSNNRTGKQDYIYSGSGGPAAGPPRPPPPIAYHYHYSEDGRPIEFPKPLYSSSDGYKPGRPPASFSNGYLPGLPPPNLQFNSPSTSNGYHPPVPPPPPSLDLSSSYEYEPPPEGYFSANYMSMPAEPGAHGSSYYSRPIPQPAIYQSYPSETYFASSPTGNKHKETYLSNFRPPPLMPNINSGSTSSGSATVYTHPHSHSHYGWHPHPITTTTTTTPKPEPTGSPSEDVTLGWGPPPPPIYPPRPVPEFSHQFSLKPSAFGWETSYNVPCGSYKIEPRVIAHLRLATQAVLPKKPPFKPSSSSNSDEIDLEEDEDRKRRKRSKRDRPASDLRNNYAYSLLDPFQLERSLHYSPYHKQQFSIPKPTFKPRMCRWNFNAVGGCKLGFKCDWFQLPALFQCNENSLHVTDNTYFVDRIFCGNRRPRQTYSSSGKLTLTFKSEGAALPAILDCTVICLSDSEDNDGSDSEQKTTLATTELPPIDLVISSAPLAYNKNNKTFAGTATFLSQNNKGTTSHKRRNSTRRPPNKPQLRRGNCKCGVPDNHYSSKVVHGRIVGGSSMIPGESPWTAGLVEKNRNRIFCGASLLNSRFLISAAHCVINQTRKPKDTAAGSGRNDGKSSSTEVPDATERFHFEVLLNEHDISQPNEIAGGTIRAKVDKVIIHPNYDNTTYDFDAALIRLAQPVDFNPWEEPRRPSTSARWNQNTKNLLPFFHNTFDFHSLKRRKRLIIPPEVEARAIPPKPVPICLPTRESGNQSWKGRDDGGKRLGKIDSETVTNSDDNYGLVTGWGYVKEGGGPSNELLKARVQIFNDSTCHELYKTANYIITKSMICAGYINGKIDSCVGDSGSPLAIENGDRFVLAGVVSWGRGCGRKQLPGVYTKVTELMDWIYDEASTDDTIWCS